MSPSRNLSTCQYRKPNQNLKTYFKKTMKPACTLLGTFFVECGTDSEMRPLFLGAPF